MLPISPLDYLITFLVTFIFGALWATCFGCYASKIRREVAPHA